MTLATERLQSAWLYQGAAVLANPALTCCQKDYALTLRRQLVERLAREAAEVSTHFTHAPFGAEWAGIFTACRREAARTRRAARRLAHQVHA